MDINVGHLPALAPPASTLRLAQLAKLLRRNAWLVALCGLGAAAGAYAYARTLPKVYTANSTITVEGDRFAIPELQGALRGENAPDPMPWVRTEVQALTSRALVQGVATQLKLEQDPEFNAALRPPGLVDQAKDAIRAWMPQSDANGPVPGPDEMVLGAVGKVLGVFQDNRSLVISVSFTAQDPRLASGFINTLVGNYIQSRAKRRVDANQEASTAMGQRIAQVRDDLNGIEKRMRDMRSRNELVGLRAGSVGQQQLEELTTAAARASLERGQAEANYERATALSRQGSSDALASVLGSSTISQLREQETTASRRLAELSSRYGSDHPSVRSATADVQSVRRRVGEETQRIVASLGTQLRVAREHETDIQRQLVDARRAGVVTANAQSELTQLEQEATSRRALYQTLMERAQQTMAQPTGTETPDVRVLSPAVPPGLPSGPNMKVAVGMGGLGGVLLGCLLALTRLRTLDGFSRSADVTVATGLSVLATLPRATMGRGRSALPARVCAAPAGPEAEAMRVLRTRLRFSGRGKVPRTVLFTSVGTGASSIAAALARVAAVDGERVLLLEGNLHAPELGGLLGIRAQGLLPVLTERADWRDAVVSDRVTPLDLLLAGRPVREAHELLSGIELQNLLIEAREEYDLVVLDAPAASSATAAALAQRVDATVLVVDAKAPGAAAQEAATRLGTLARTPVAAVMVAQS